MPEPILMINDSYGKFEDDADPIKYVPYDNNTKKYLQVFVRNEHFTFDSGGLESLKTEILHFSECTAEGDFDDTYFEEAYFETNKDRP